MAELAGKTVHVIENRALLSGLKDHLKEECQMGVTTFSIDTAPVNDIQDQITNTPADYIVVHLFTMGDENHLQELCKTVLDRDQQKPKTTVVTTGSGVSATYDSWTETLSKAGLTIVDRAYKGGGTRNFNTKIADALKQLKGKSV